MSISQQVQEALLKEESQPDSTLAVKPWLLSSPDSSDLTASTSKDNSEGSEENKSNNSVLPNIR